MRSLARILCALPPCLPTLAPLFPPPFPLLPHVAWALHLHPLNADQIYNVKGVGKGDSEEGNQPIWVTPAE